MTTRKFLSTKETFKLAAWATNLNGKYAGLTLKEICDKASKELKFHVNPGNVARDIFEEAGVELAQPKSRAGITWMTHSISMNKKLIKQLCEELEINLTDDERNYLK